MLKDSPDRRKEQSDFGTVEVKKWICFSASKAENLE